MTQFKAARVRARLTQREVANLAGVSEPVVRYVEQGKRPSLRVQRALAVAVNGDPEQFWPTPADALTA